MPSPKTLPPVVVTTHLGVAILNHIAAIGHGKTAHGAVNCRILGGGEFSYHDDEMLGNKTRGEEKASEENYD